MSDKNTVNFPPYHVIFREGDLGDDMYIIVTGSVEVTKAGKLLAHIEAVAPIGEMALVEDEPRSATVTALTDVVATRMTREEFRKILAESHPVIRAVVEALIPRLEKTSADFVGKERSGGGG